MLEGQSMKPGQPRNNIYFILGEAAIYLLYFVWLWAVGNGLYGISGTLYVLFVVFSALIMVGIVYIDPALNGSLKQLLGSKDLMVLMATIVFLVLLLSYLGQDPYQLFQYYPVYFDEINFRFIIQRKQASLIGDGRAVIVQSALYMLFYSSIIVFESPGYPFPYNYLFLLDMFSMGIIYGLFYYLRKNIYLSLSLHFSLLAILDIAQFLPISTIWIPYTFSPL